jgi:hypothetical protein
LSPDFALKPVSTKLPFDAIPGPDFGSVGQVSASSFSARTPFSGTVVVKVWVSLRANFPVRMTE